MAENVNSERGGEAVQPAGVRFRPARLDLAFVALTVVGLGISGYLSWAHLTYTPIICTTDHSCDTVNRSAYAYFPPTWGVPVAYLGFAAYLVLLGFALWRLNAARQVAAGVGSGPTLGRLDLALFVGTLLGLIFSAYLTAMELFVINAICWWCVGSATVITLLFAIAVTRVWAGNEY